MQTLSSLHHLRELFLHPDRTLPTDGHSRSVPAIRGLAWTWQTCSLGLQLWSQVPCINSASPLLGLSSDVRISVPLLLQIPQDSSTCSYQSAFISQSQPWVWGVRPCYRLDHRCPPKVHMVKPQSSACGAIGT